MKTKACALFAVMLSPALCATSTQELVNQQVSADLNKVHSVELKQFKQAKRGRGAGFVSVGPDGECDYNIGSDRIQNAIDSGAAEIRITTDDVYTENLVLDDVSVIIRGGYTNCVDANNGAPPTADLTSIDGSSNLAPVFEVTGDNNRSLVVLENLFITNSQRGGIDTTSADALIEINDSFIGNNSNLGQGGGISIFGGDTDVIARNTSINQNSSTFGGGIGCQGFQASVLILGQSTLQNNAATGSGSITSGTGGAVYLAQACTFSVYSGASPSPTKKKSDHSQKGLIVPHFLSNEANTYGGAISSVNTSKVFLFGQQMCVDGQCLGDNETPIFIFQNQSGVAMGGEDGGAIRLRGDGNEAIMNGIFFNNNESGGNGGALSVEDGAALTIYKAPNGCWNDVFCNALFTNTTTTAVGLGGAIYNDNASVDISSAFISENRADFGTAVYAFGTEAVNRFEGVIFNDNGDDGADGFSDNHVLSASIGASMEVIHSTFADNHAETSVFGIDAALDSSLNLQSSIVHDASSGTVINLAPGLITINCLMAHEQASVVGSNVNVADPQFIDPSNGNFGLNPQLSPAIDYCDDSQITLEHLDYNNQPRGWDDPSVVNGIGPFDLGVYESYANDIIFENGFEFVLF